MKHEYFKDNGVRVGYVSDTDTCGVRVGYVSHLHYTGRYLLDASTPYRILKNQKLKSELYPLLKGHTNCVSKRVRIEKVIEIVC